VLIVLRLRLFLALLLLLLIQRFLFLLVLLLKLLRLLLMLLLHLFCFGSIGLLLLERLVLLLLLLLDLLSFLLLLGAQLFLFLLVFPIQLGVASRLRSGACRKRRYLIGMNRRLRWPVGRLRRTVDVVRIRWRIGRLLRWSIRFGWLRWPIRLGRLSRLIGAWGRVGWLVRPVGCIRWNLSGFIFWWGVWRMTGLRLIRLRLTRLSGWLSRPIRLSGAIRLCLRRDRFSCGRCNFHLGWARCGHGLDLSRL
jgi:hypothetical protein